MAKDHILGLDIGGTGLKAAIVDVKAGELVTDRLKVLTPQPAEPESVGEALKELIGRFDIKGDIGVGFPAVVINNVCQTAGNISSKWIGLDLQKYFKDLTGRTAYVANDADVAGLCEMQFGAGKGVKGLVLMITLGTGIGSALFQDGELIPNFELGHAYMHNGLKTEHYASNKARKDQGLSYVEWGHRFNEVLEYFDRLCSPNKIILGGGLSKKMHKYREYLNDKFDIVPAEYQNAAGAIGAGLYAVTMRKKK